MLQLDNTGILICNNSYNKLFYATPNEICHCLFNKFQSPKDELSFREDGFIFSFFCDVCSCHLQNISKTTLQVLLLHRTTLYIRNNSRKNEYLLLHCNHCECIFNMGFLTYHLQQH